FIVTSVYFHQAFLADTKGWTMTTIAASYPFYAATSVIGSVIAGWIIDRVSARLFLPVFLLPLITGLSVLAIGSTPAVAYAAFALFGVTSGFAVTIGGTLWAELYGTRHLGAVRALFVAAMVFSSALGPSIVGWLIDAGFELSTLLAIMAAYCAFASLPFFAFQRVLAERAAT
ncbi:MAG: MFS transporter, partial [Pseudomonadota bacterium]